MNVILLSFACGLALIYGVRFSLAGPSWTKSVIKTGSVLILAALAFIGGGPFALVLGLLFGTMGDFWLSRDGERPFLLGLVSFAIGHIAYIVLLWQFGAVAAVSIWTVLLAGFSAAMALYLWQPAGALRGPVLVYIVIIAALGILALGLPEAARLGTAAALVFVVSDAVLSVEVFILRHGAPVRQITSRIVWGTYFAAQLLFLLGFGGQLPL